MGVMQGLDLQSLLSTIINLEGQCDKGMENAERREVEKNQKIKLREVRKIASDTETISQEKIERLASKCVLEVTYATPSPIPLPLVTGQHGRVLPHRPLGMAALQRQIKESTRLRIQLQKHEKQLDLVKLERDRGAECCRTWQGLASPAYLCNKVSWCPQPMPSSASRKL